METKILSTKNKYTLRFRSLQNQLLQEFSWVQLIEIFHRENMNFHKSSKQNRKISFLRKAKSQIKKVALQRAKNAFLSRKQHNQKI
jgi:hypothetical protein